MRINVYVAQAISCSRRKADKIIDEGKISINGQLAVPGDNVDDTDQVKLEDKVIKPTTQKVLLILNKPVGYVCSKNGQGSHTVYELLPEKYQHLNSVGRLDKDSSGLLLFTNDGELANKLSHPRYDKNKIYIAALNKELSASDFQKIKREGVKLDDGKSVLGLERLKGAELRVTMSEGRNRQIRRTFAAVGYKVVNLHRTNFGPYKILNLEQGKFSLINIINN